MGFDTVWVPDELLWRVPDWPGPRGWWECVATAGAVAACTSTIAVGTWVMSSHYRNPTLTAKIVETLDEIAGGRFIFGLGSGSGDREAEGFGYPKDHVYSRFAEALDILVPLLRNGRVDHRGGLRPGKIPLMKAFVALLDELNRACEEVGRDPGSIGRSIGVFVEPTRAPGVTPPGLGESIRGPADKIAQEIATFGAAGVTQVEIWPWPFTLAAVEALAPVVAALDHA